MKTAVEWLQEKISYTTTNGNIITYHKDMTKVFEEAKEMEKDQICEAYAIGGSPLLGPWEFGEEYYNNTFKSE